MQLEPGVYRCSLQAFSQDIPIVDPLGNPTVQSNLIEFKIGP